MTKPTRVFVLLSGGILVAGLGTGLLASYLGGFQGLGFRSDGPDELAYVPAGAGVVAFADLNEVRGTDFHRVLRNWSPGGSADRLESQTGIDLEHDVDRLVAAMSPAEATPDGRPLLLVRGRFDRARIEELVQQQGGTLEEYGGTRLLAHPRADIGLAFVESGLVALGSPDGVRGALDVKAGRAAGIRGDADLMQQVRGVEDGHAWAVIRGSVLAALPGLPHPGISPGGPAGMPQLTGFTWLTARGHVDGGIRATLRAEATDEASANNLREAIRGAMALGRMGAAGQTAWADLVNSIELGGQGRTVSMGFAIPATTLDSLRPAVPPAVAPPGVRPSPGPGGRRSRPPGSSVRPRTPAGARRTTVQVAVVLPPGFAHDPRLAITGG